MDKRRRTKRCSVCGDAAVGFNFGAVACESCKAFFRRTATKSRVAPCLFNEQCKVDVATRRFCSHCRLRKCFSVGMKTSLILDEKAKHERREKIKRNRQKRSTTEIAMAPLDQDEKSGTVFTQNVPDSSAELVASSPESMDEALDRVLSPEPQGVAVPPVATYPSDQWRTFLDASSGSATPQITDISDSYYCRQNISGTVLQPANTAVFVNDPSSMVAVSGNSSSSIVQSYCSDLTPYRVPGEIRENPPTEEIARLLSHYQWTAVNDLCNAYEANFVPDDSMPNLKRPDLTLSTLINTSLFMVRKLINFAKTLVDFSQLRQDCQISLLKGVVLSTLFLFSARHYNVEKDAWLTPNGEVSAQILKVAVGMDKFYDEHTKYCRDFNALVAHDPNLVALMQVLLLFTPDRPSLDARQTVANVHDRYYLLLKHYLEAKAGFAKGRSLLAGILTNLDQLQALTMNYSELLMQLDPNKVDPLLMEIFNLTPPPSKSLKQPTMIHRNAQ